MTQKQTDYDKAEQQSYKEYCDSGLRKTLGQDNGWLAHELGFRDGYRFCASQQMEKQKAEQQDHFRDSTKMLRAEIAMMAMQALIYNYGGRAYEWISENAVEYADALIKELEKEE